ncbi:MAG TPA: S8 family peptidase [Chakrabartia sp.]|nr:S8 family peptidase [Chakrabartia sp.]
MSRNRRSWMMGCALFSMMSLSACGGGTAAGTGGGVASTPTPASSTPTTTPTVTTPVTTPSTTNYDTAEYQRSNAAVQAGALTAYQQGATGAGVIAAIVDGGIANSHSEFAGRIHAASADVVSSRGIADESGHGTSVAAVLAAARNDSGAQGVAFGATLLIARTDKVGSCAESSGCSHDDNAIARGVDLAVANKARVINISLGGSPANVTLRNAIDRATAAGIVIVISAGNVYETDPAKGANPDPLAMVATDSVARKTVIIAGGLDASNAALTNFSNRAGSAQSVYLGALAYRVRSIDENGTAYLYNGTSYAAPAISGAVALLAQAFPNLSGAQIVDLLFRTATDLGEAGVDSTFGNGALNIARAFQPQGQTALAGSAIPVSTATDGGLSAPMGDASPAGMNATFLDSYGRAYTADLGQTLGRARLSPRLFNALDTGLQGMRTGFGPAALTLSVRQGGSMARVERTLLAPHETAQARALAGQVMTQLTGKTAMAFGISTTSARLQDGLTGHAASPFLMAGDGAGSHGFDYAPRTALMMAHKLGRLRVFGGGETGDVRRWDAHAASLTLRNRQVYRIQSGMMGAVWEQGPLSLTASTTVMNEERTVLGARFAAFLGSPGARTLFADAGARLALNGGWQLKGQLRSGWTRVSAGGIRQGADHLRTNAWSFDVEKAGLFSTKDQAALRISQPLRVSRGGFSMLLPTGYDYASGETTLSRHRMNLAPSGREIDMEGSWSTPLGQRGSLSTNLFWRQQPGNIAAMPADKGGAVRLDWRF